LDSELNARNEIVPSKVNKPIFATPKFFTIISGHAVCRIPFSDAANSLMGMLIFAVVMNPSKSIGGTSTFLET
jgi:hypothetical protein